MLMASHLAGVGQASGTGVGLVHALGPRHRDARAAAHGTALAAVLPEVLRFYLGTRDRELALVGIALGVASRAETRRRPPRRCAIGAIDKLLRDVDQRPTPVGCASARRPHDSRRHRDAAIRQADSALDRGARRSATHAAAAGERAARATALGAPARSRPARRLLRHGCRRGSIRP